MINLKKLEAMLEDDPAKHVYRLDRSAFTDEQLFELEMKYIFEGNWVYLAHESQIPNVNDFLTVYIGRQPVVITRSKDGNLNALANTCTHRGAICAATRRVTNPALPALSTAGLSTTAVSCSRSRTRTLEQVTRRASTVRAAMT